MATFFNSNPRDSQSASISAIASRISLRVGDSTMKSDSRLSIVSGDSDAKIAPSMMRFNSVNSLIFFHLWETLGQTRRSRFDVNRRKRSGLLYFDQGFFDQFQNGDKGNNNAASSL